MENFDADRAGTGTAEWAEVTENISRGCSNNCLYCYAASYANRFKLKARSEWEHEEFTKRAAITSYPARKGVVMFPSSHDITPFNVEACIRFAKLMLKKGNNLLIVSKPRLECIRLVLKELNEFKEQILFRFTIGTLTDDISLMWEPGAPLPSERIEALSLARASGFRTSVSIEPMLEDAAGAIAVVEAVRPFVTDTIWIGKMNKVRLRVKSEDPAIQKAVDKVTTELQSDESIMTLYRHFKDDLMIRWKDSIKDVVARATSQG